MEIWERFTWNSWARRAAWWRQCRKQGKEGWRDPSRMALNCFISSPQRAHTKHRISGETCFSKNSASDSMFASKSSTKVLTYESSYIDPFKIPLAFKGSILFSWFYFRESIWSLSSSFASSAMSHPPLHFSPYFLPRFTLFLMYCLSLSPLSSFQSFSLQAPCPPHPFHSDWVRKEESIYAYQFVFLHWGCDFKPIEKLLRRKRPPRTWGFNTYQSTSASGQRQRLPVYTALLLQGGSAESGQLWPGQAA